MGSGKSNQSRANSAQKSAVSALQPKSYSDPYGSFSNGVYTPNLNAGQQAIMGNADNMTANAMSQVPQHFSVSDYFNNPFYANTLQGELAPISQKYNWDMNNLNSDLNAQGQTGSSYDALQHQMLNQNYNNLYTQALSQARNDSANAYQQSINNALNTANTASNLKGQTMNQIYQPYQNALAYQNAMNPLQTSAAQVYTNAQNQYLSRPTFGQNLWNLYTAAATGANHMATSAAAGG